MLARDSCVVVSIGPTEMRTHYGLLSKNTCKPA